MSSGLLALLDDVAAIAKVAAASIDDVAGMAAKAGVKSAGVLIDDAAVTPRYVVGFTADRELPIIRRIAVGSLKNKLIFLLPAALVLALLAPWAITPLLMLGGLYLCFEGAEKVAQMAGFGQDHAKPDTARPGAGTPKALEDRRVQGAIRTDFILSAEIMALTLASIPAEAGFAERAAVLAIVGVGVTMAVYGAVALIVKADDFGVHLATRQTVTPLGPASQALGRGIVTAMPGFLKLLTVVGTLAMLWVGGGILIHGLGRAGLGRSRASAARDFPCGRRCGGRLGRRGGGLAGECADGFCPWPGGGSGADPACRSDARAAGRADWRVRRALSRDRRPTG
jgi:predicted DNA repair protein MutK